MATTASLLPTFPRIFFLYVEPICIAYGMVMSWQQSTSLYLASPVLPLPALNLASATVQHLLTMMLYNFALLLGTPPSKKMAQATVLILAIADLTHWAGLAVTVAQTDPRGLAAIKDTSNWSSDVWQLATYPLPLLVIKFGTLLGLFGKIKG